jgi:hypothetical protein
MIYIDFKKTKYKARLIWKNNIFRGLLFYFRKKIISHKTISNELPNNIFWPNLLPQSAIELKNLCDQNPKWQYELNQTIKDFLEGYVKVYNKKVRLIDFTAEHFKEQNKRNDIKYKDLRFRWELYRHRFIYNIGFEYFITRNESVYQAVASLLKDYNNFSPLNNPDIPYNGMEASLKLINLSWVHRFFNEGKDYNKDFKPSLIKLLIKHGNYIYNNYDITKYGLESNHGLTCSIGLVYASILFPGYKNSKKWRRLGEKSLLRGLKNQFSSDGVNFESSSHYHRFVFELLVFIYAVLIKNNDSLGKRIEPSVKKISSVLKSLTHSNDMISRFGDNDGGLFLPAFDDIEEFSKLEYLNAFIENSNIDYYQSIIFKGVPGVNNIIQQVSNSKVGNYLSFKTSNLSLIASGNNIGTNGKGNHQHNDFTSFELYGRFPFIVDPWSYCYTGDRTLRNRDRKTLSHNCVEIDGRDIVPFKEKDLFEFQGKIKTKISITNNKKKKITGSISHNGYVNIEKERQEVTRTFELNIPENKILITDNILGKGNHNARINFLIPIKYWTYKQTDKGTLFSNKDEAFELQFNWELDSISEDKISPQFLNSERAYSIIFSSNYHDNTTKHILITYSKSIE